MKKPYIIVFGNEKGGTGKSTLAMHVIVYLLRLGFKVGSIDVDARQGSLTRYVENRAGRSDVGENMPVPTHHALHRSTNQSVPEAEKEDTANLEACFAKLAENDFIVIDTPGSDTYLSRLAHSHADALITPLNDSLIDLDMLVRVTGDNNSVLKPSIYAETVWEQKKHRAMRNSGSIDWIVVRNRLTSINSRNKEEMAKILEMLSRRIGFRLASGFGERVIFRELFLSGLTVLDIKDAGMALTMSHLAAKQELHNLVKMIQLPLLAQKIAS
jgi:chromosome partitioning protein